MEQEDKQQDSAQKVLTSFHPEFLLRVDEHWKKENFKNRSEYINHVVRKDLEKSK